MYTTNCMFYVVLIFWEDVAEVFYDYFKNYMFVIVEGRKCLQLYRFCTCKIYMFLLKEHGNMTLHVMTKRFLYAMQKRNKNYNTVLCAKFMQLTEI